MSPMVSYTSATEFYTSFKVLFGDSAAGSTATSGVWTFYQGAGANYSDNNDAGTTQVFTGLRFTYGAAGALTLTYNNNGTYNSTSLTTSAFSQATVYTVEIVGNNKTSGTISYTYNGAAQTVAVQKFDLYINGTKVGDDLTKGTLPSNTAIASVTFTGVSSTSNVANMFVDDVVVYNAVPAAIGFTAPTVTTGAATSVTATTVTLGGNITATGGTNATERGIYYSTTNGFADGTGTKVSETAGSFGTGAYTENVTGLTASTVYYFKAFATGPGGTGYGTQGTFTTTASGCTPPTINTPPSDQTVCSGGTATFTVSASGTTLTYQWRKNGSNLSNAGHYSNVTTNTLTVSSADGTDAATSANGYDLVVTENTNGPCSTTTTPKAALTVNTTPATPGAITQGSPSGTTFCANATGVTYSITAVAGATSYTWTLPSGGAINGSATGSSITVDYTAASSGNVTVTATNACGTSAAATLAVTATASAPATPGAITQGNPSGTSFCGNSSGVTYSIAAVSGATSYTWTLPTGGVIQGSATGNSITVNYTSASSGNVTVTANNTCGSSSASTLAVTASTPPSAPTGQSASASGCTSIAVSWTAPGGTVTGYNVKRSTTSGSGYTTLAAGTNVAGSPFTDTTGVVGVTYYYVVSALNGSCESVNSVETTGTSISTPLAPTAPSVSAGNNSATISWTAPTGPITPTGYNVKRSTASLGPYTTLAAGTNVAASPFTDTTAVNGTPYYYVVTALNGACESAATTEVTATPSVNLLIEDFNYTAGQNITANGWTAHSVGGTNPIKVTSPGLTYCGYASSGIGNAATLATSGEDDNKTFAAQTAGSVYAAFMVNVASAQTTGDYFLHFFDGAITGNLFRGRVFVKKDASSANFAFGLNSSSTAGALVYTPFSYSTGTTYLVVLKYTFNAGANNDQVALFINPAIGGAEPTADLTVVDAAVADATNIDGLALRQGSATAAPTATVDGIRVATTWSDVAANAGVTVTALTKTNISCHNLTDGTVTATFSGGSGPYTVQFDGAGGFVTQTSPHTYTGLGAGTHTVEVKDVNGCSSGVQTSAAIVNPSAVTANAAADTTICSGSPYSLNGSGSGGSGTGYTFAWTSTPGSFTSSSANPSVSPTVSTTYHLTVTDSAGCTSANKDVVVTVNPSCTSIESWRSTYFGTSLNTGNAANTADPDGDGMNNLLEFAFGTNPTVSQNNVVSYTSPTVLTAGSPTVMVVTTGSGASYYALYSRRVDYVAAGLTYTVEFSADLSTWVVSTATPAVVSDNGTIQAVTVPYPFFINGKKARFFRVTVSISP